MNATWHSARVGLFFLLGLGLIWATFETLSGGLAIRERGYTLLAPFEDLKQLRSGDEARMGGVRIGSVETTRLSNGQAEAVLRIDRGTPIPEDSHATIGMAGMLGQNYVNIVYGSADAPVLQEGDTLPTQEVPDFNEAIAEMGKVGQSMGAFFDDLSESLQSILGDEDDNVFNQANLLIRENRERIGETLEHVQSITGKIDRGEGTVGKLINDPDAYDEILATISEIRQAAAEASGMMGQAREIITHVREGEGTIGRLLYDSTIADDLTALTADARDILAHVQKGEGTIGTLLYDDSIAKEFEILAANLRELSEKLNEGEGTLGKLISDDDLYRRLNGMLLKAERALDSMDDQGPITAVGVAAGALF